LTTRRFDAADRIVASTDANGNQASYEYDVMGRIVSQRVTDAVDGGTTTTTWRYEGTRLVAIDHPDQAERYSYDAQGRVNTKTVILTLADGRQLSSTTRFGYDDLGQLASISLPDGSTLGYKRNGQNQITALERCAVGDSWLRKLLPRQTIVRDIERDVVGIKHLTFGNGIEAYYQRSKEGSLARIVYRDPRKPASNNRGNPLLEAMVGIRHAQAASAVALPGALGLPSDPNALLDHRYLWDSQGNLLYTRDKDAASSYAYEARDRLIVAATAAAPTTARGTASKISLARYHYDDNGNRLLAQEGLDDQSDINGHTVRTSYEFGSDRWHTATGGDRLHEVRYDAVGQPNRIGNRSFVWDAFGKLLEVRDGRRVLGRYRYNHRGERIEKIVGNEHTYYLYEERRLVAELDSSGTVRRQYIYLGDLPVAIIDNEDRSSSDRPRRNGLTKFMVDVTMFRDVWLGKAKAVTYLQTNHLGAIELITDAEGKPLWHAAYSPFGKLIPPHGKPADPSQLKPKLRLPGQYEDDETGLYYNDRRYYDATRGRYLTPDPLGLAGGSNGYTYVNGNPMRYIDPQGLVLFAFDGTNNSNPPPGADDFSNVYKFFLAYDATQNGPKWYMNGIGRDDPNSGIQSNLTDAANANTAHDRVKFMEERLDSFMSTTNFKEGATVNIDIVGFSRGAAMARDFANRIATRLKANKYKNTGACVQLRFMGLWDTVAQFGVNGVDNSEWSLAIPEEAKNVFQAVALNEHRYAFPGEAIGRGTQRGFIGSHADIGGSYGTGDLSDVALNWIVDRAKESGIKMFDWGKNGTSVQWGIVTNPVLHSKGGSDRDFCLRSNHEMWTDKCKKQKDADPGGMTWRQTQTENLISMYPKSVMDADGLSEIVGKVNMKEYSQWLKKNYALDMRFSAP
jgi:RHS repeat-associated protein